MKKVIAITLGLTLAAGVFAGCSSTTPTTTPAATQPSEVKVFQGLGQVQSFRVGPGKDDKEVQVYSFTYLTANVDFDKDGKIVNAYFDSLEVSTPNYDGESMPHFSGWPGIQGYNVTDHASAKVTGVSQNTNESIAAEVKG